MGNVSMTINNKKGHDEQPPTLISGQVLTPVVSLADEQPRTSSPAYMGISVRVTDVGSTAVAGGNCCSSRFWLPDQSNYFHLVSSAGRPGQVAVVLLGGQVEPATMRPDEYRVPPSYISANADNYCNLPSVESAGDTDFSTYFSSKGIAVIL